MKIDKLVAPLMNEFDKVVGKKIYDVAHLFEHPEVVENAIRDALILHI